MPFELTYRAAQIADSDAIASLVTDLGYPTSPEQMKTRLQTILADRSYATFVASAGAYVVGFVGVRIGPLYESDSRYGQIMGIAVSPNHRRMGIGRQLMEIAEGTMIQMGAQISVLGSGNHRVGAHAFYEALGYKLTGRRYKKTV